jgi:hypothetical protein
VAAPAATVFDWQPSTSVEYASAPTAPPAAAAAAARAAAIARARAQREHAAAPARARIAARAHAAAAVAADAEAHAQARRDAVFAAECEAIETEAASITAAATSAARAGAGTGAGLGAGLDAEAVAPVRAVLRERLWAGDCEQYQRVLAEELQAAAAAAAAAAATAAGAAAPQLRCFYAAPAQQQPSLPLALTVPLTCPVHAALPGTGAGFGAVGAAAAAVAAALPLAPVPGLRDSIAASAHAWARDRLSRHQHQYRRQLTGGSHGDDSSRSSCGGSGLELARSPLRALYSPDALPRTRTHAHAHARTQLQQPSSGSAAAVAAGPGMGARRVPVARPGWPVKLMDPSDADGLPPAQAQAHVLGGTVRERAEQRRRRTAAAAGVPPV